MIYLLHLSVNLVTYLTQSTTLTQKVFISNEAFPKSIESRIEPTNTIIVSFSLTSCLHKTHNY